MSNESATLADAVSRVDAQLEVAAAPVAAAPAADASRAARFVQFTIESTSYAVSEGFVTELDRVPAITLVPQTPAWLRGVTSLRGDVLSVVDLRVFLGLEPTSAHTGRMLVVRLLDEERTARETFGEPRLFEALHGVWLTQQSLGTTAHRREGEPGHGAVQRRKGGGHGGTRRPAHQWFASSRTPSRRRSLRNACNAALAPVSSQLSA